MTRMVHREQSHQIKLSLFLQGPTPGFLVFANTKGCLPVTVVVEFIVTGKCNQNSESSSQGKKYLGCSINPHLKSVNQTHHHLLPTDWTASLRVLQTRKCGLKQTQTAIVTAWNLPRFSWSQTQFVFSLTPIISKLTEFLPTQYKMNLSSEKLSSLYYLSHKPFKAVHSGWATIIKEPIHSTHLFCIVCFYQ